MGKRRESLLWKKGRPVKCVETGQVFPSVKVLAEYLDVDEVSIRKAISGLRNTCRGFRWTYADGQENIEDESE